MPKVLIELPAIRDYTGTLKIVAESGLLLSGPFRVSGRASDSAASAHDNPSRNPMYPYGDTPIGDYRIRTILASRPGSDYDPKTYGPNGIVVLDPIAGVAALAEASGRFHLFIHGGSLAGQKRLAVTNGCLRLSNADMRTFISDVKTHRPTVCHCVEVPAMVGNSLVALDAAYDVGDPPPLRSSGSRRLTDSPARREFLFRLGLSAAAVSVLGVEFLASSSNIPAYAGEYSPSEQDAIDSQDAERDLWTEEKAIYGLPPDLSYEEWRAEGFPTGDNLSTDLDIVDETVPDSTPTQPSFPFSFGLTDSNIPITGTPPPVQRNSPTANADGLDDNEKPIIFSHQDQQNAASRISHTQISVPVPHPEGWVAHFTKGQETYRSLSAALDQVQNEPIPDVELTQKLQRARDLSVRLSQAELAINILESNNQNQTQQFLELQEDIKRDRLDFITDIGTAKDPEDVVAIGKDFAELELITDVKVRDLEKSNDITRMSLKNKLIPLQKDLSDKLDSLTNDPQVKSILSPQ